MTRQERADARSTSARLSQYFSGRGIPQLSQPGGGITPLRFAGPAEEHLATRRAAGLFDFSFMGCWEIAGYDALDFLQYIQTRDLRELKPGKLCYTLLCREDGSVINDATVWYHEPGRYWLFTGRRKDEEHIVQRARDFDVKLDSLVGKVAVIAVQGPASHALLESVLAPASVAGLPYFGFRAVRLDVTGVWIGRLGYSGELGYEIIVPAGVAAIVWERFRRAGEPYGLRECGFEAANSLRIESGYVLYSRELALAVTPCELGFARLMALNRPEFIGSKALRSMRAAPLARKLAGMTIAVDAPRRVPYRAAIVANITSEAFSPLFGCVLAIGFVDSAATPGTVVYTEDGRRARITRLPFYDPARVLPRQVSR